MLVRYIGLGMAEVRRTEPLLKRGESIKGCLSRPFLCCHSKHLSRIFPSSRSNPLQYSKNLQSTTIFKNQTSPQNNKPTLCSSPLSSPLPSPSSAWLPPPPQSPGVCISPRCDEEVTPILTEGEIVSGNLAFLNKRACDCPGVQACCKDCLSNGGGEKCCNTTCMDKFPDCYNAC